MGYRGANITGRNEQLLKEKLIRIIYNGYLSNLIETNNFPMATFFSDKHTIVPEPEGFSQPIFKGTIPSVSFSGLSTFEQCQYALYLDKVKATGRVSGPAADRGSHIHELLELYVKHEIDEFDWKLLKAKGFHKQIVEKFREDYTIGFCQPEIKFGLTKDIKIVDFDTAQIRGVIDILNFLDAGHTQALVYDYKTGSDASGAKHRDQLMMYVLIAFIMYPTLEFIRSAPIYLDHRKPIFHTDYQRKDFDILWPNYHKRLMRVLEATTFTPNPNGWSCKWCSHRMTQESLNQTEPACEFAYVA